MIWVVNGVGKRGVRWSAVKQSWSVWKKMMKKEKKGEREGGT